MAVLDVRSVSKTRENMTELQKKVKNDDKNVFLIAHELKLARVLAGNNKHARDKALKNLKKWLQRRPESLPITEKDFQILWKGLFYSMWMSDKPLVQEECAENIAQLVHMNNLDSALLFFKVGLKTLINEWIGIDQLRLDKFLMFVRRLLRQCLIVVKNNKWTKKNVDSFTEKLSDTILSCKEEPPMGLFLHFTEIYLEEIAKITEGHMNPERVTDFLVPFIEKLASSKDRRQIESIEKHIFYHLIRQSNLGLEYQAKYEAWKQQGFPGSINSMQKITLEENENMSSSDDDSNSCSVNNIGTYKPLDPRAGRVDVELPQLKFHPKAIAEALLEHKFKTTTSTKTRKKLTYLADRFIKLASGQYPIGIKKLKVTKNEYDTNVRKAANRLIKFEKKIMGKEKKRKRNHSENDEPIKKPKKLKKIDNMNDKEHKPENENKAEKLIKCKESQMVNSKKAKGKGIRQLESERKLTKKRKYDMNYEIGTPLRKQRKTDHQNAPIDFIFKRNSGTWIVYDESKKPLKPNIYPKRSSLDLGSFLEKKLNERTDNKSSLETVQEERQLGGGFENKFSLLKNKSPATKSCETSPRINGSPKVKTPSPRNSKRLSPNRKIEDDKRPKDEQGDDEYSNKVGISPVKLFDSPEQNEKALFPKSTWDEPLEEGEYEICVPSRKYVTKMKKHAKKNNQSVYELINNLNKNMEKSFVRGSNQSICEVANNLSSDLDKIIAKNKRLSLDSNISSKNRYIMKTSTPSSSKKVKINTKLNRSQEFHEHHAQILRSPGLPYDANKKPSKPLLKTPTVSTPINPFYKQLEIW